MQGAKSNKIYVILVICIGVVTSIWLIQRNQTISSLKNTNVQAVSGNPYRALAKNDDWKKILTTVDNSATDISLIKKSNSTDAVESDSTLTDQMSRDFLSQYLLAVKNNGGVSSEEAAKIAKTTLSLPAYTTSVGAKYIAKNLHINPNTDYDTVRIYRNKLFKIVKERSGKIKNDPLAVIVGVLTTENETNLAKLDSIIVQSRGFLSDLLALEVPQNAVELHLDLLNAGSNILANLESMRQTLKDPVKGLAGITEYTKNISDLNIALQNFNQFFAKNL